MTAPPKNEDNGGRSPGHAGSADRYHRPVGLPGDPGGYPNGRRLTDDIVDLRIAMTTMGRVTMDGVGPPTDLLDEFPYLGAPHGAAARPPEDSPT